jgi:hypothetical protein
MRAVAIVWMGAVVALCVLRHHAVGEAVATVPVSALVALAGLHLVSLVARSEAWRLSLAAIGDSRPSRTAIHTANAGAFVAGSLQGHAAIPARVALLRRLAPDEAPHPAHVAVADVPIFLLEVAGASLLLALTGAWWAPPAAVATLVGARLIAGRRATRGLAVLADGKRRVALATLVACIVACGALRVWVVLAVMHLDASPAAAAGAFAALGLFGLLPLGPSAPPGALLVVSGGAGALAAGLALSATSIAAVVVYAAALALRRDRAQVRLDAMKVEGPEAVEARVVGPVEVGRARRQQAPLGTDLGDEGHLGGIVRRIEGLDAVEAQRGEALDRVPNGLGADDVPERMRPDRHAAGVVNDRDRLRDGGHRARPVGGRARHQIGLEKLRGVHDFLFLEAHPVGRMLKGGLSEVRTPDRGALRQRKFEPARTQRLGHADGARRAVGAVGGEGVAEDGRAVIDEVAEDVQVVPVGIERGELHRGDDAETASQARLQRLVDAVHRVMVGQRQQLDARVGRRRHDGLWW